MSMQSLLQPTIGSCSEVTSPAGLSPETKAVTLATTAALKKKENEKKNSDFD